MASAEKKPIATYNVALNLSQREAEFLRVLTGGLQCRYSQNIFVALADAGVPETENAEKLVKSEFAQISNPPF